MFSIGEHPTLSKPVKFSLAAVFGKAGLKIKSAEAMSLTGNEAIEAMDKRKHVWATVDITGGKVKEEIEVNGKPYETRVPFDPAALEVNLRPMEVRTFAVEFE